MLTTKIYVQARQTPDKTAIVFNDREFSYRLFACLIEISRRYLAAQGLAGEGVVVLPTGSMVNTWVLGLALRSLGLTTLIVSSPDEIGGLGLPEIRCVVAVAGEHRAGLDGLCADSGWRFISVPKDIYAGAAQAAAPDLPEPMGSFGGHILLTSGTTGAYKKFQIDPASETVLLRRPQDDREISAQSVFNVVNFGGWTAAGYWFPASTWDAGGTVVMYQDPHPWESFRHPGITHAFVTPRLLSQILTAAAEALRRDDAMRLFVGSGPLSQAVWDLARQRLTSRIYTSAGATEALQYALTPIGGPEDLRWHRILPSREVQVVDEADRILPAGQVGRVRVRLLDGMRQSYLHDEEASRAFFRDGYFYPGDLGVFRSDGRLALHGRVTDVVNILGSKIAAGPIEEALQHKLGVSGVCVFSVENEAAEEEIHVAIETARPIDQTRLADALGRELQGAPIAHVHFIAALPRNDMGKIQRDVLKKSAASLTANGSRQQRRRSQRLARKASQGVRVGTAKPD